MLCFVVGPAVRHVLYQGDGVWGLTTLGDVIYVLRAKESDQIAGYNVHRRYRLQQKITFQMF